MKTIKQLLAIQKKNGGLLEIYPSGSLWKCRLITDNNIYYSQVISRKEANKLMEIK